LILVACSSLHKQAKKHLADESYTEAMSVYKKILESNTNDEEATAGLREARTGWLNQKLVEVKFLRLSGDRQTSLELLYDLYQKENSWKLFLIGPSANYQKKEINFALIYISKLVSTALSEKKPLKAQFILDKYRNFYQSESAQVNYNSLQGQVKTSGIKQCRDLSSKLTKEQFYYGSFVAKFCNVWNLKKPNLLRQIRKIRGKLYSSIKLESMNSNLPPGHVKKLNEYLLKGLKKTPWYTKSGKNILKLSLDGKYKYTHSREEKSLKHSYLVSIPYTEERIEKKSVDDKKSNFGAALELTSATVDLMTTLSGGKTDSSHTTDNGDGTVTVHETKYREEPREAKYIATEHTEVFNVSFSLTGLFNHESLEIFHDKSDWKSSIQNNNSMPEIGLKRTKADLIGKAYWFDQQSRVVADTLEIKLNDTWDSLYCNDEFIDKKNNKLIESMFRCLKVRDDDIPKEFENLFELSIGLTIHDANKVVDRVL
ncbi:hypothetical protein N9N67_12595, partial [Bacteriovoracaceae bacterium]|nr:hypothetical protein [Bacteriovoracaceae bacterium]